MTHNHFYECWARRRALHCARVLKEGESVEGTFVYPWLIVGPGGAILSSCFNFHSPEPLTCPQVTQGFRGWVSGRDGSIVETQTCCFLIFGCPVPFFFFLFRVWTPGLNMTWHLALNQWVFANFLKANVVCKTSEILASMINCRMRITTSWLKWFKPQRESFWLENYCIIREAFFWTCVLVSLINLACY